MQRSTVSAIDFVHMIGSKNDSASLSKASSYERLLLKNEIGRLVSNICCLYQSLYVVETLLFKSAAMHVMQSREISLSCRTLG